MPLTFTHTTVLTYKTGESTDPIRNAELAVTGPVEGNWRGTLNAAASQEVEVAIDAAKLKSLGILSDHDATLKTNDAETPGDEIELLAGVPVVWNEKMATASPITANVTKLIFENSAGAVANIEFRSLSGN